MAVKLRNPDDTYGTCTVCGAYCVHREHHSCPPVWLVRMAEDREEDASPIFARNVEQAAEKFCEECDCDLDYSIIRNGEATLIVQAERGGPEMRVYIEAERRAHYSGSLIEEPTPEETAAEGPGCSETLPDQPSLHKKG